MRKMVEVKQLIIYSMYWMEFRYHPWKSNHSNNSDKAIDV